MGKLNKNQLGFGTAEILLAILIVALLGVVGWFVYDRNHNKIAPSNSTVSPATQTTTPATTSPTKTGDYLEIKQLGIKIPTAELTKKDVEYTTVKAEGTSYVQAYVVSTSLKKSLATKYPSVATQAGFSAATVVLIPTSDFQDGSVDFPNDSGRLMESGATATIGNKKLFVFAATFSDIGTDYVNFVNSVKAAAKDTVAL